ncbi:MAG: hypothetical protein IBJ15_15965 [Alphaproteobacteria bacterium]|nr:hypothetical protein [Alphaproteobacteria bacterium]
MKIHSRFRAAGAFAAVAVAGLTVAACTGPAAAPTQIQASNPSVTYTYRSDQDLIQANRAAATHCARYSAVPQTMRFFGEPSGERGVVFDCVPAAPVVAAAPVAVAPVMPAPALSFTYAQDQELLQGTRSAQLQCANAGMQQALAGIVTNVNGTKTATFQCVPR